LSLTYLLRHLPTYLQPWDLHGAGKHAKHQRTHLVDATTNK